MQRGYLGVNVTEVTNEIATKIGLNEPHGVYIVRVIPNCAAAKAGMKEGDILLKVNGVNVNSYASMMEEVALFNPGDEVKVQFLRDGKVYEVALTLLNSKGNTDIVKG